MGSIFLKLSCVTNEILFLMLSLDELELQFCSGIINSLSNWEVNKLISKSKKAFYKHMTECCIKSVKEQTKNQLW